MKPAGIIVLEGADASGKTTLARELLRVAIDAGEHAAYLHGRPWVGCVEAQHDLMCDIAIAIAATPGLAVCDHFWLAEELYGREYRSGPAYDTTEIDGRLASEGAVTVLCVPSDLEAQAIRHGARRMAGGEEFADARGIIRRYADLARGNLLTYVDSGRIGAYVRHGDFTKRPDVVTYDLDGVLRLPIGQREAALRAFAASVVAKAARSRRR